MKGHTTGTVQRVAIHNNRYGILVNDIWYNDFGKCPVDEGDEVSMEFEEVRRNGTVYYNIKRLTKATAAPKRTEKAPQKPENEVQRHQRERAEALYEKQQPKAPAQDSDLSEQDERIIRCVALKCAVKLVEELNPVDPISVVVQLAKKLEPYLKGGD